MIEIDGIEYGPLDWLTVGLIFLLIFLGSAFT